jgi:hypothetical protein
MRVRAASSRADAVDSLRQQGASAPGKALNDYRSSLKRIPVTTDLVAARGIGSNLRNSTVFSRGAHEDGAAGNAGHTSTWKVTNNF